MKKMKKRNFWMMTFALAVILAGCGAGGRGTGQETFKGQETESTGGTQNAREEGHAQNTQTEQDEGHEQDTRRAPETAGTQNADAVRAQVMAQLPDEEKNWMGGLDREQRVSDFESLCSGLRDNYPYLCLAKRQLGADLDVLESEYRQKVEACANDDDFYCVLRDFVREFSSMGHLDLWGRRYESELAFWRAFAKEPGRAEQSEAYIAALDNPVSKNTYASMTAFYQNVEALMEEKRADASGGNRGESAQTEAGNGQAQSQDAGGGDAQETAAAEAADVVTESEVSAAENGTEQSANVETRILEAGKTAYVFIDGFDHAQMEADCEILLPFYEEVKDYENLIIDITNNLGGSMQYFNELVAAPLAEKTLTVPTYQFFKGGDNNKVFLRMEEGVASGLYRPVSELPDLPKLNRADTAECDWFLREDYTVEPTGDGFGGKLWLLVSENNYSSSEYAAMFAKKSGFATLVGHTTSGDGIGTNPFYLILPNSGLVVQYSPMYGVSADGTGSEECGTEPDIVSPEGESALETCLGRIKKK